VLQDFISYSFSSSILIPVDTFSFTFAAPDGPPFYEQVKEGDQAVLEANGYSVSTGVIDSIEIGIDGDGGEMVTVTGRDLLCQLEDQDAISVQDKPIWANRAPLIQAVKTLVENTVIQKVVLQDAPTGNYLFATEPGETKLSALQRFCEPLNCIFWLSGDGSLVVGKPNMRQAPAGEIIVSKSRRYSNVTAIKVLRSSTQIPNIIVPIWSGQEATQDRTPVGQRIYNAAAGPNRLRSLKWNVPKGVVVSAPNGSDAQSLSQINTIELANGQRLRDEVFPIVGDQAAGGSILQAYAKREIARANHKEVIVQASLPGHYNDNARPFQVDTCYNVSYDRGSIEEKMYLFQVEYSMDRSGQRTLLYFCRLGTIVADVRSK
jgi:prophage tail gpP-like protein